MECLVCGESNNYVPPVLDRGPTVIWTGACDNEGLSKRTFECKLFQCLHCGHVQQDATADLEKVLAETYASVNAQLSTEIGKGAWGLRRASQILDEFDIGNCRSVLEIGCANGYLLEHLKSEDCIHMVGIEPSIERSCNRGGIKYIKAFANADLDLNEKFDFVFAICVLEHIKDVKDMMRFIWKHLNNEGLIFIEVPNHQRDLESGDPKVFVHEHIHYFTEKSLSILFNNNGFKILKIKKNRDSFFVSAQKSSICIDQVGYVKIYSDYDLMLDKTLDFIKHIACDNNIAFHGVNNSLNNILEWTGLNNDFGLFDNDEIKIGKKYFGKSVLSPNLRNTKPFDCIIVIPTFYRDEIKKQYEGLGFRGKVLGVVLN